MQLLNDPPKTAVPIQHKVRLSDTDWLPYDTILTDSSGNGSTSFYFDPTTSDGRQHFFRAVTPVPQINLVQPGVINPSGGQVFLIGQLFDPSFVVKIDGNTVSSSFTDANTLMVNTGALSIGFHTITLFDSTNNILVSLTNGLFVTATGRTDQESPPTPPLVNEAFVLDATRSTDDERLCGDAIGKGEWDLNYAGTGPEISADPHSRVKVQFFWDREGKKNTDSSCWIRAQSYPGNLGEPKLHPLFAFPSINEATGELFVSYNDLVIPGRGLDLVWGRTYRSKIGLDTPMGVGWDFSYNIRAAQNGSNITVQNGENRTDTYFLQADGSYSTDELFRRGTLSVNVFTLQFGDKTSWVFKPLDGSLTSGKIDKIIDRNSNQLQFQYDGSGRLVVIIDTLGRPLQIGYDAAGRIQLLQDFSGRQIVYTHQTGANPGDLLAVRSPIVNGTPNGNDFPSGKTAQFTYTSGFADAARNHNLLTARDGNNVQWYQAIYTPTSLTSDLLYDRVASQIIGTASETKVYTYLAQTPAVANRFAATKAIVNDANGHVHESLFDGKNRRIDRRQFTGHSTAGVPVTESTNRPTGPLRASDPAFFKTTFDWNRDSLPTRMTLPRGNGIEMVYQRDFDPAANPRERANLRVRRQLPVSGAALVARFDYQPGFGTCESASGAPPAMWTPVSIDMVDPGGNRAVYRGSDASGLSATERARRRFNDALISDIQIPALDGSSKDAAYMTVKLQPETPTTNLSVTLATDASGLSATGMCVSNTRNIRPNGGDSEWQPLPVPDIPVSPGHYTYGWESRAAWTHRTDARGFDWRCDRDANGNAVAMVRPDGVTTDIEHNASGQLTAIVWPQNNTGHRERDEWHYSTSGAQTGYLQTFIRDAGGLNLTTAYQYDAVGNLIQVTDPRGTATQFAVNQLNQVVQTTYQSAAPADTPVPYLRSVSYDANNRVASIDVQNKDEFGSIGANASFTTTYAYDALDHVTAMTREVDAGHSVTTQYVYDADRNLTEVRSPLAVTAAQPDARVQYAYDERNLPFTSTGAPGSAIATRATYTYDTNGNLTKLETGAPAGSQHTTTYVYDGFDRLTQRTDPVGTQSQFTYNTNHQLLSASKQGHLLDTNGNAIFGPLRSTTFTYDSRGTLTRTDASRFNPITSATIGDGFRTTSYTYDPALNLTNLTDDNGHATLYSYDGANRLSRVTDPKGNRVDYTYDSDGNLVTRARTDKSDLAASDQVFTTTYVYDGLDRLTSATDNVGNMQSYSYDSRSNLVRSIDARNDLTQCEYDGLNRLIRSGRDLTGNGSGFDVTDIIQVYSYDDNSRLLGRTDPNNHATQYVYDPLSRVTRRNNADTTFKTWSYDPWGRAIQSNDENGTNCIYTYDGLSRLTQRQITPGSGVSTATTFEIYDYPGDYPSRIRAVNDFSTVRMEEDSCGYHLTERLNNRVTTYTYDGVGNLVSVQSPGGRVTAYTYDAANHCSGMSLTSTSDGDALGQIATYDYVGGRLEAVGHRNGTATIYTYDGFVGAPVSLDRGWGMMASSQTLGPGSTVLDQRTFSYDANQNLSERQDTRSGGPLLLYHYDYDAADRLVHTQVTAPGPVTTRDTTYTLDLNGNRSNVSGPGTPEPRQLCAGFEYASAGGCADEPVHNYAAGELFLRLKWQPDQPDRWRREHQLQVRLPESAN